MHTIKNTDQLFVGTDEVGRGCVAGPIIAGAFSIAIEKLVTLKHSLINLNVYSKINLARKNHVLSLIEHDLKLLDIKKIDSTAHAKTITEKEIINLLTVKDSKKTTSQQREKVISVVLKIGEWGMGHLNNKIIDDKGISYANNYVLQKSISNILKKNQEREAIILSDHFSLTTHDKTLEAQFINITKGDSKSFVIAAASIIAKQYRDIIMLEYSKKYPNYGFDKHVGYGTAQHMEKIKQFGLTPIHRKSFLSKYII